MNQMQQMLMNAQRMQRQLQKAKDELAQKEFAVSKSGIVDLVMMGDRTVKSLKIDADALEPDNADMISDAVVLALYEALEQIQKANDEVEEQITGKTGLF